MFVSALVVGHIVKGVAALGVAESDLRAGTGIEAAELCNYGAVISVAKVDLLVRRAMQLTGDPGLGLTIAANAPPIYPSFVAQMVSVSKSLRDAFSVIRGFADLLVKGSSWSLHEEGGTARCVYHSAIWLGPTSRFAADLSFAFAYKLAQRFMHDADGWPDSVSFRHPYPSYAERYDELFRCPIEFDAPTTSITFPASYLDRPSALADGPLRQALKDAAEHLLSDRGERTAASDLRALLRDAPELANLDRESIARRMGISARSLRRKLRTEGVSLTDMLDEARRDVACQGLRDPRTSIQAVAEQAGFNVRSAFHRAFKRWTGETPTAYRRRLRAQL